MYHIFCSFNVLVKAYSVADRLVHIIFAILLYGGGVLPHSSLTAERELLEPRRTERVMPPPVLADQLTLSQPAEAEYPHHTTTRPPDFQTFLRPCKESSRNTAGVG